MLQVEIAKIHDLRSGEVDAVGTEVLVDRLWPRGVKKDAVQLQAWLKGVAPSPELREWFCHDPEKFADFTRAYTTELDERVAELAKAPQAHHSGEGAVKADEQAMSDLAELLDRAGKATASAPLVLVYAAKDRNINHAVVLAEWLREQ